MEIRPFARYALPLLLAVGMLVTAGSAFTQKPAKKVDSLAEVTKACKDKKPGETVKVGGKAVTCQIPTSQVAAACANKKAGARAMVTVQRDEDKKTEKASENASMMPESTAKSPQDNNIAKVPQSENIAKAPQSENIAKPPQYNNTAKPPQHKITARAVQYQQVECPPACCYINGCIHPENRKCL